MDCITTFLNQLCLFNLEFYMNFRILFLIICFRSPLFAMQPNADDAHNLAANFCINELAIMSGTNRQAQPEHVAREARSNRVDSHELAATLHEDARPTHDRFDFVNTSLNEQAINQGWNPANSRQLPQGTSLSELPK